MQEKTAVHYGKVEFIPGNICDSYVLNDGTPVMSEGGVAKLLEISQKDLQDMTASGVLLRTLKPFILDKNFSMATTLVKVTAKNSPDKGKEIAVYDVAFIESFIRGYALALANNVLLPNQKEVGKRCLILMSAFIKTALDAAAKEACDR